MTVTVRYMGQLRQAAAVAQETVEVAGTVDDLLRLLNERHPGGILASALVFIDDEQAERTTPLHDGATVTLLSPIAGGER